MARKTRGSRREKSEDALDRLFCSAVPPKDSGPDPLDILAAGAARAAAAARLGPNPLPHTIVLDEVDRDRANQILTLLSMQTGEQPDLGDLLRVALQACPMDAAAIALAWAALSSRGDE